MGQKDGTLSHLGKYLGPMFGDSWTIAPMGLQDHRRTGTGCRAGNSCRSLLRLHSSCRSVYHGHMGSQRLNITLDEAQAAKLSRLAARVHVNEGTLARSLLSTAIDDADPDPANVVAVLDGIDGAWERAQLGNRQAEAGKTISLGDL
jgi:hypothetical protein